MKIFKIIIIILLVSVMLLGAGLWIFLKTLDLDRFRDRITQQISQSIGRDVRMRHVAFKFSINRGVMLSISGLSIADHPDFFSGSMLYIDSAYLDIDIVPFLSKRQILISKVEFNSVTVNLIRNSAGEINFQKFITQVAAQSHDAGGGGVASTSTDDSLKKTSTKEVRDIAFGEILIRSIRLTDGTFIFTDQMTTPPTVIPVTQLEFQITNLSFDQPFPFQGSASLWGERSNIDLKGLAQINSKNQQVRIDDLKLKTNLSDLSLESVYVGIPTLRKIGLKGGIGGKFVVDISQMILGEGGLLVLSSDVRLTGGRMQFKGFPIPVEDLAMHLEITESDVIIRELTMPLASGELKISGQIVEYLEKQKFVANLDLKDVQLRELASHANLPMKAEGRLFGSFKSQGQGINSEALKSSLIGEGVVEIKEGRIVDINVLKLVLSKVSFIPNLVNKIEENLPDRYREKLKSNDTILEKVEVDMRVRDGTLYINQAEVVADGFLVIAKGRLDFDQNLSLESDFYIPADLSANMVASAQELSYFLDERRQIHIPLKSYNGKLDQFRMYPDVEDIMRRIMKGRARQELRRVIDRAIGRNDRPSNQGSQDGGQPAQSSDEGAIQRGREISPEEAIIESILDIIPIFQ